MARTVTIKIEAKASSSPTEGGWWDSVCESLDVSSQGIDEKDSLDNLESAIYFTVEQLFGTEGKIEVSIDEEEQ